MPATFSFINGISFGLEFIKAHPDADVPHPCVILDLLCFRWIFELSQGEKNEC